MTKLLSPPNVADRLSDPRIDPDAVFCAMDVKAFQFCGTVETDAPPLCMTQFQGYGDPVAGVFVVSPEEAQRRQQRGETVIVGSWGNMNYPPSGFNQSAPHGVIVSSHIKGTTYSSISGHLLSDASRMGNSLIDNPHTPIFEIDPEARTLTILGKHILREGDAVTIHPMDGKLWRGKHPVRPAPDYYDVIARKLTEPRYLSGTPRIAFHCVNEADLHRIILLNQTSFLLSKRPLGLIRSENATAPHLVKAIRKSKIDPVDAIAQNLEGAYPIRLIKQVYISPGSNFRLLDIRSLKELLPAPLKDRLDQPEAYAWGGELSKLAFRTHKTMTQFLYHFPKLVARLFPYDPHMEMEIQTHTITAVNVNEPVGAAYYRDMVLNAASYARAFDNVRFGLMIEDGIALQNAAALAKIADSFCIGGNDLAAALTGCKREVLDHSDWMKARGYAGTTPARMLVPEVYMPLWNALIIARKANPNLFINFCGMQTDGGDIGSIDLALAMGAHQLTVPPIKNHALRTQAAICRFQARQRYGLPTLGW